MKSFIFALAFLMTTPAWAVPLTFEFAGTLASNTGTVEGSVTYESTEAQSAVNIHGLNGNTAYAIQSWDFTVQNDFATRFGTLYPHLADFPTSIAFSNTLPGDTAEFCIGTCIFSNNFYDRLYFTNGQQTLQLLWYPPTGALPQTIADWGTFDASNPAVGGSAAWFESRRADGSFQIQAMLTAGAITGLSSPLSTQAVPEPATLWLLMAAGALWITIALLKEMRARANDLAMQTKQR